MSRIDAHQHFWSLDRGDYGWLTPECGPIYRDFGPEDLRGHLLEGGIEKTLLVQAAPTLAETKFLLETAASCDFVAGVIGWVDMNAPDAHDTVTWLAENPLFLGIRPMIQDIPDPAWMLKPEFNQAFKTMIDFDLAFEALVKPVHLENLLKLCARWPELRVVVDHGAKPDVAGWNVGDANFILWADLMQSIADCGASCKLSGLVTEAPSNWSVEDLLPYMEVMLDAFGSDRLMYGSDWPVVELACGYNKWWAVVLRWLSSLNKDQQNAVLGENAARFYKL